MKKIHRLAGLLAAALGALLISSAAGAQEQDAPPPIPNVRPPYVEDLAQLEGAEFEIGYINRTIPHHQGAIQMASIIAEKAPHAEVRQAAEMIIQAQTTEIAELERYLQEEYGQQPDPDPRVMLPPTLVQQIQTASPEQAEKIFLLAIREHHQVLNIMSGQALTKDASPFLTQIATGIIATQSQEQTQFAVHLEQFYGIEAPVPTGNIEAAAELATGPLPTTGGTPLPDTGGPEIGPQSSAVPVIAAGLALLATGVGGYALLRRRGTFG